DGGSRVSVLLRRRLPVGAEIVNEGVDFRGWAPFRRRVDVVIDESRLIPMHNEQNGYFSQNVDSVNPGAQYRFRLDGSELFPDSPSRFQPEGPHCPSQVVNPSTYKWNDSRWEGIHIKGQVIYEIHIGTFTREGTWNAAATVLDELAKTGITLLEIMPVAEFA